MKKYNVKQKLVIVTILSTCLLTLTSYAHPGKTDSNGGHRDKNNKSGLGSYHYHCGGHPAHLHPDGVCPYSSSSSSSNKSSSTSKSNSKATATTPSTVEVTSIQINETSDTIEVYKTKNLTATITPDNATDKSITWKSSNEDIATVSSLGIVTAKKSGTVDITASTSNGKSSTIKISVVERTLSENNTAANNSTNIQKIANVSSSNNNQEDSNGLGWILTLGLLGGGGYLIHKKG